nr:hypothetical protein [uncultured Cetobacterium sp.]
MKKVVLCLFILTSIISLSNSREDMIEKQLMEKYPSLTDGTNTIKVHEYDVEIKGDKTEVKIEIKGDSNKEVFEKFDQEKLGALFTEITEYAQTEITKPQPIELEVELDRDFAPDEYLYKNTFLD